MLTLTAALLLAPTALADEVYFTHQGRVADGTGAALEGTHTLTLTLYDAATAGSDVWSNTYSDVTFQGGYFSVALSGLDDTGRRLDAAADSTPVWLGVAISGVGELGPRQRVASYVFAGVDRQDGSSALRAALSCDDLKTRLPSLPSGPYWIDPDGPAGTIPAFYTSCDMDGAVGWTLVLRGGSTLPTAATWNTTSAWQASAASDGTQNGPSFKLADAAINAFTGPYRTQTAGTYTHLRYTPATCVYAHTTTASGACATTCSDASLTDCEAPGSTVYGRGLSGGVGTSGHGCGVRYFATAASSGYMNGPTANHNMYWIVQVGTASANNTTCAYGPSQRWADNGHVNADSTLTVWRQ